MSTTPISSTCSIQFFFYQLSETINFKRKRTLNAIATSQNEPVWMIDCLLFSASLNNFAVIWWCPACWWKKTQEQCTRGETTDPPSSNHHKRIFTSMVTNINKKKESIVPARIAHPLSICYLKTISSLPS
jgi:hypothetical protein